MQKSCGCVWHYHAKGKIRHYTSFCEFAEHLNEEADKAQLTFEKIAESDTNDRFLASKAYEQYCDAVEVMFAHYHIEDEEEISWIRT